MSELEKAGNILERMGLAQKLPPMSTLELLRWRVETENNAVGDLDKADGYDCPLCRNKGVITELRGNEGHYSEVVRFCECKKIRQSIMRLKRSGLEELVKRYCLEDFTTAEAWQGYIKDRATKFLENPAGIFFIGGQSGCGKTFICTAIAKQLMRQGKELRYELWRDKSVFLKGIVNRAEEYQQEMNSLKSIDVLYLDDFLKIPIGVDSGRPTSADLSLALEIINSRYNNGKLTLISSEWTLPEIVGFDEALGGRIYEMAGKYGISIKKDRAKNQRFKRAVEL